jgi:hypothetical protein
MKTAIAILFVMLCAATINGAEIGKPTWAKTAKATAGTMTDITVTVPVTKVSGREAVSCTVRLLSSDGKEVAHAECSDILTADGSIRNTIQVSKADASTIVKATIDH